MPRRCTFDMLSTSPYIITYLPPCLPCISRDLLRSPDMLPKKWSFWLKNGHFLGQNLNFDFLLCFLVIFRISRDLPWSPMFFIDLPWISRDLPRSPICCLKNDHFDFKMVFFWVKISILISSCDFSWSPVSPVIFCHLPWSFVISRESPAISRYVA